MANNDRLRQFYNQLSIEELCQMHEAANRTAEELALEIVQKRSSVKWSDWSRKQLLQDLADSWKA